MSAATRGLRWLVADGESEAAIGLEHVELKESESGVTAEGVAIAGSGAAAWSARWRITLDAEWACLRSLHLTRLGGATVALRHDGYGEWSDGEGRKRPEFSGLTDAVVIGSPFGPMSVIKRLGKKAAKAQTLDVVAVALPGLEVTRLPLVLRPGPAGRLEVGLGDAVFEAEIDAAGEVRRFGAARLLFPAAAEVVAA